MGLDLDSILARHRHDKTRLLQILREIASEQGHVPREVITRLARALSLPRGQVEGVVAFYSFLSDQPQGRFRVLFSDNITDQMQGSLALRQRMLDAFRIGLGETSRDGLVSVDVTSCTGLCDQGPAMLVNGHAIARLTPTRIGAISALIRGGSKVSQWPGNLLSIESHVRQRGLLLGATLEPGEAIREAIARSPQQTLAEIERSQLRGRGGAGFGTGAKWAACAAAPGPDRYVVCNADEGEPGTFKDRELLTHHAHEVIEGMTVAALLVGAQRGLIYLRGEYLFLQQHIESVLAKRRELGLLGQGICGQPRFDFDVELHMGAGAYVCGEESALLESLEGKRGIPRNRPPYPVTSGYLGRPTVVNNVETLLAAAHIARQGAGWFRAAGTARSAGTKILSIAGDVARPGTYEVPFGVSFREILDLAGASEVIALQVGGPSGTLLSPRELDRKLAFEDVPSAGAITVFDRSRDVITIVDNFTRFFAHESCGFCTPCRVGTALNQQIMARIASGKGSQRDLDDLHRTSQLMRASSHCGLGHTASNPIIDATTKFKPSFDQRLTSRDTMPVFDLDEALAAAREVTARDDAGAHLRGEET